MNELRVRYMLEALRTANHPDDYNFRKALRKELANELNLKQDKKEMANVGVLNDLVTNRPTYS